MRFRFRLIAPWLLLLPFTVSSQQPSWVVQGRADSLHRQFLKDVQAGALVGSGLDYHHLFIPAAPMMLTSLIAPDSTVRSIRNLHLRQFRNHYDDYVQLIPLVAQLGMRTAGIEGHSRHIWQTLTADLTAAVSTAIIVNSLKYSIGRTRPDGSSNNSFPSGHTATAFMSAHLFQREYGARYPLLGSVAYFSALTVGVGRVLNNRHWAGDVLFGAGAGIFSAELGYIVSDLIFSPEKPRIVWFPPRDEVPKSGMELDISSLNIVDGFLGFVAGLHHHSNPISATLHYRFNSRWRLGTGISPSVEYVTEQALPEELRPKENLSIPIKRIAFVLQGDYDYLFNSLWGMRVSASLGLSMPGQVDLSEPHPLRMSHSIAPSFSLELGSFVRLSSLFEPFAMIGFYHQPLHLKITDIQAIPLERHLHSKHASGFHPLFRAGFTIHY